MDRRQFLIRSMAITGVSAVSAASSWSAPLTSSRIAWQTNLRAAHALATEQNRPLLLVFSAEWCHYCHKLIREAGADKSLSAFIMANFIPMQIDFDKEQRIAAVLEVESLPTTVVLSPKIDLLLNKPGYMKVAVFRKTLEEVLLKQAEIQQVNGSEP
jgi:thioredoxin-related protein